LHRYRFAVALLSHYYRSAIAALSLRYQFAIASHSSSNHFEIPLQAVRSLHSVLISQSF
jgi:hypothetical protein